MVPRSMHTVLSPFVKKTQGKLLDGEATESHGRQFKSIQQVKVAKNTVGTIIIYPGHSASCVFYDGSEPSNGVPNKTLQHTTKTFIKASTPAFNLTDQRLGIGYASTDVARWRAVSVGVRCMLLNSSETNEGWWESYRVVRRRRLGDWRFVRGGGSSVWFLDTIHDDCNLVPDKVPFMREDAPNDESYNTGSLKMLHTKSFELKRLEHTHNFISPRDKNYYDVSLISNNLLKLEDTGMPECTFPFLDENFDAVVVNFYAGTNSDADILLDATANHEFIYSEDSTYAQFMTKSYRSPSLRMAHSFNSKKHQDSASVPLIA